MTAGKRIGLVLEGGGMRGLYTAGVLDIMMDHGFMPDVICGTSAGVTFGVNLPSGQRGRVLRYNCKYVGRRDYVSFWSYLTTGNVVNTEFAYDKLPRVLDPFDNDAFKASGVEFYATATNVLTGKAEYMLLSDPDRQMDIIRASASLPFLSKMVNIDGIPYLDGGVSDNIPLDKCISTGCDRIVVILTRTATDCHSENLDRLCRFFYPKRKEFLETCAHRSENYDRRIAQISQLEKEGKIFVIRPSRLEKVSRLEKDAKRLKALYDLGVEDSLSLWNSLEEYLR